MATVDDDFYDDEVEPRTSVLNLVLCFLNVAAAGAFVWFLFQDLEKRQSWSYSVFLHDVVILGLPLEEEEKGPSASREVQPSPNLRSEQLQAAYQGRKAGSIREPFQLVDEPLPASILPSHFNDDNLKDVFGDMKPFVKSLDEEIKRLKEKEPVVQDIAKAAAELAAAEKTDAAKRQKLERILLPLACNVFQVRALDKRIRAAKGEELEKELTEAAQRRMLIDILQPVELMRPGDATKLYLEKTGDLTEVSLEFLETQLKARLDHAIADKYNGEHFQGSEWSQKERDTVEKRQDIALLLFAIGHVNKPDGTPLYPRGPERVQAVVGLYQFALAAQAYTAAVQTLEKRMIALIRGEREGNDVIGAEVKRTPGFVDRYPVVVQRLRDVIGDIDQAQKRLGELKELKQQAEKNYADRVIHLKEISDKLVAERDKTLKLVEQLRLVQASLFRAHLELADAADTNFRLEIQLRKAELGGKAP